MRGNDQSVAGHQWRRQCGRKWFAGQRVWVTSRRSQRDPGGGRNRPIC